MQSTIAITITALMGLTTLFFPFRMAASAQALGYDQGRRIRIAVLTFVLLGGWFALVLWGSLNGFFLTPLFRVAGIPTPHVTYLSTGPVILGALLIWRSPTLRALLDTWQPHRAMLGQMTRLIGGVFLIRYFQGDLPGVFALPAGIGDVLIGLTAPVMAYLYATRGDKVRRLAIGWNVLGILDLVNALVLGFLALGLRVLPGTANASDAGVPTTFPLVLIPGFGVPLTMLLHIITLRLLRKRPEAAPNT